MRPWKKIFFGLILVMMVISPIAKAVFDKFDYTIMPLKGYVVYAEYPEFSWEEWFEGSWQTDYDKYLEDHIGLRNLFVRTYNQIDYSLFRKTHAAGVIVGKEDYLYELNYILAYTGKDYLGDKTIKDKCSRLKVVQEELRKLNTELLIVLAPGKASFFPEFIPEEHLADPITISNNEAYLDYFREYGINHIDFNSYFLSMKDTSSYELFPKCGIHWSEYGSWLALDSIVKYIEDVKAYDMVDIGYEGIEVSGNPRSTDYDIGDGLNLICRIPGNDMPYPFGLTCLDDGKVKPNLMVIADSYYWSIYNKHYNNCLWDKQDFRFYNQESFTPGEEKSHPAELSLEEMGKFDVIMLLYTEANMPKFANNFIDQAHISFMYDKRLQEIIREIKGSSGWMQDIEVKARERGVSTERMINLDARWILDNELAKEDNQSDNN